MRTISERQKEATYTRPCVGSEIAWNSKKSKKPEPVTVSLIEYDIERAGTHSAERRSAVKADFMTGLQLRWRIEDQEVIRFKGTKGE